MSWEEDDTGRVILSWNEFLSEDVVQKEEKAGFGSTLVQLSAMQLNGRLDVSTGANNRRMTLEYVPSAGGKST